MRTNHAAGAKYTQGTADSTNDEIDFNILQMLRSNARATNDEIGRSVGLSPSAVSRRIHNLESRKIITGYRAELDDQRLGRSLTAFIRISLEKQSAAALASFEASVARCSNVLMCYLMSGEHDYLLQVKVADMEEYEKVHQKQISRLPGVSRIESSFAVREVVRA